MLQLLFIFSVQLFVVHCVNPTLNIQANPTALKFFGNASHLVIDKEVPKIDFPDIQVSLGGIGNGYVNASNLKIEKFSTPQFVVKLTNNGITWSSSGGGAKILGNWYVYYEIPLIKLTEKGTMKVTVSDIELNIAANATTLSGRPQFAISDCSAFVHNFHITFAGDDIVPWLLNILQTPLSAALKKTINTQACTLAKTVILDEANKFLLSLPVHIPIGEDFYVDYFLLSNPYFAKNFVKAELTADVIYKQTKCGLPSSALSSETGDYPGMFTIWISSQIPNCLFSSAHYGNFIQLLVSKDNVPEIASKLQTSCSLFSVCMGKFFKKLRRDYPNKYVDLHFHSLTAPQLILHADGFANITAKLAVDMYIHPKASQNESLARLVLDTSSRVSLHIQNKRLVGTLNGTTAEVSLAYSKIGDIGKYFLTFFRDIFLIFDQATTQALLKNGIVLPIYDNVTIADTTKITIFGEHIRVNLDFATV